MSGCVGIIVALKEELLAVKELINNCIEIKTSELIFYRGYIDSKEVILCESGVGKVNAARVTQCLIDYFKPVDYIFNIGVAGGIDDSLVIGDIVIGDKLIQYDYDVTKLGGYEIGQLYEMDSKYFFSDKNLVDSALSIKSDYNLINGLIGSADLFLSDVNKAKYLNVSEGIKCVEMEGAAVAQVSYLNKIPFLIIRGISDVQNNNNKIDFESYLEVATKQVTDILKELLVKI